MSGSSAAADCRCGIGRWANETERWPISLHRCAWSGCEGVVAEVGDRGALDPPAVRCASCGDAFCDQRHGKVCWYPLCGKEWYCGSCEDHMLQHYDDLDVELHGILVDWHIPDVSP